MKYNGCKIYDVQNKNFPFADYMALNAARILEHIDDYDYIGRFDNLKAFLKDNDDGTPEYKAWVKEFVEMLDDQHLYSRPQLETL